MSNLVKSSTDSSAAFKMGDKTLRAYKNSTHVIEANTIHDSDKTICNKSITILSLF